MTMPSATSDTRRDRQPASFGSPPREPSPLRPSPLQSPSPWPSAGSHRALRRSAAVLLRVLVAGQGAFLLYVLLIYGRSALRGDPTSWSRYSAKGWMPGDTPGNAAMAAHVLLAAIVLVAGAVQLLPTIRQRAPHVHRWSGRLYLTACLVGAVTGLWLVWVRGTVGDTLQHVAISINAILLGLCAGYAWRTARARAIAAHRVWAMRTFLVAGGVFYFRMFLALWLLINRRPVGFDPHTFSGPFLSVLSITVYAVGPLALYEGYRRVERAPHGRWSQLMTGTLWSLALLCTAGAASATLVLWLPRLRI